MTRSADLLQGHGPLSRLLDGFAPREPQIAMAAAVERALEWQQDLVIEAGTGIGKTLAYLVPAVLRGARTIISTGTKTLQDQLYFRDLPLVIEATGVTARTALLKGRSNYLCLQRMERTRAEGWLPDRAAVAELEAVREWSARTRDGDLSLASVLGEDSVLVPLVTSTAENCLGSECPHFDECFVVKARRQAQDADIVVVNHHLLFADMAIRQRGFGEVLPGAEVFVIDEAHLAPDIASQFFSLTLSGRQVEDLCRDLQAECAGLGGSLAVLQEPMADCRQAVREMQLAFASLRAERGSWAALLHEDKVRNALQLLDSAVARLADQAGTLEGGSRGMDNGIDRVRTLKVVLDRFDRATEQGEVRWYERRGRGFALHITPLEVAGLFDGFRSQSAATWVFTSATLAVDGDFSHFSSRLGLEAADTLLLDSPFNYARQAMLWLPEHLPEPREPEFIPCLLDLAVPLLEASRGRAFLLFTSHRALREAAAGLSQRSGFPLFVQGEQPRSLLLGAFRSSGNGVLLGTASFWEGVDVMGDALVLVIIDKLPFAAPDDPVTEARSERLRRAGGNPFLQLFLPDAVIALKQGAGRLIRDVNDRGVLVICDRRMRTRSYGAVFRRSLPPMKLAGSSIEVEQFLRETITGDRDFQ